MVKSKPHPDSLLKKRVQPLAFKEWNGVTGKGVQGKEVFPIFGPIAFVLMFPSKERSACSRRQCLCSIVVISDFRHAEPPGEFLVHSAVTGNSGAEKGCRDHLLPTLPMRRVRAGTPCSSTLLCRHTATSPTHTTKDPWYHCFGGNTNTSARGKLSAGQFLYSDECQKGNARQLSLDDTTSYPPCHKKE